MRNYPSCKTLFLKPFPLRLYTSIHIYNTSTNDALIKEHLSFKLKELASAESNKK